MKKRLAEAQIIGFLREVEAGLPVKDWCCPARVLGGQLLPLAEQVGGMSVSDAKRLKELDTVAQQQIGNTSAFGQLQGSHGDVSLVAFVHHVPHAAHAHHAPRRTLPVVGVTEWCLDLLFTEEAIGRRSV